MVVLVVIAIVILTSAIIYSDRYSRYRRSHPHRTYAVFIRSLGSQIGCLGQTNPTSSLRAGEGCALRTCSNGRQLGAQRIRAEIIIA